MITIALFVLVVSLAAVFVWMCMTVFVPEPVAKIVIETSDGDTLTY